MRGSRSSPSIGGCFDWHDFAGRIVWSVEQEAKHSFLRQLSRDVIRGQASAAKAGQWMGGPPPLGYAYVNKKIEVGSPSDVRLVRRIFSEYLAGYSLRGIAERLNAEKVLSPRGKLWVANAIQFILKNRFYLGEYVWNKVHRGKYFAFSESGPLPRRERKAVWTEREEWHVIEAHHEPLIEVDDFDSVQERLVERRMKSTPTRNGGDFVFTGILKCGRCGSSMLGSKQPSGDVIYRCGGHAHRGNSTCERNSVRQSEVLKSVLARLEEQASDESVSRMRKKHRTQSERGPTERQRTDVAKKIERGEQQIAKLNVRLCEVEPEFVGIVQNQIRKAQADLSELLVAQAEFSVPKETLELAFERRIQVAATLFKSLSSAVAKSENRQVRTFLSEVVATVSVWAEAKPIGPKRKKYVLIRGEIGLRDDASHNLYGMPDRSEQAPPLKFRRKRKTA